MSGQLRDDKRDMKRRLTLKKAKVETAKAPMENDKGPDVTIANLLLVSQLSVLRTPVSDSSPQSPQLRGPGEKRKRGEAPLPSCPLSDSWQGVCQAIHKGVPATTLCASSTALDRVTFARHSIEASRHSRADDQHLVVNN